jgi:hypothetical protein
MQNTMPQDEPINKRGFLKPIDRLVPLFHGQVRVIFEDDTEVVMNVGKRGPVLPRRKRAQARAIGAIR